MQNRGALWVFTILLGLACLWQMSFSFFTSRVEKKARTEAAYQADSVLSVPGQEGQDRDALLISFENKYLRDHSEERIYPVLGYTYRECKEKEINLGLDLKGGMAVTLEVSIPELIENLADNSDNAQFRQALAAARERMRSSDADFITLFADEWKRLGADQRMAAVFHSPDRARIFPREASNEEIVDALREEAKTAINNTEKILRTRIDKFGVAQPMIQKQQFSGRIQIELPGVKDKERVRKVLQSTANLEFWETVDADEVFPVLERANQQLSLALHPELASMDTAAATTTDTTAVEEKPAADTTATAETAVDSLNDETAADTTDAVTERKKNPLFSVLGAVQGGPRSGFGPAVAIASLGDTAEVNRMMAHPAFKSALPSDVRLLWSAKASLRPTRDGSERYFLDMYAMRVPRGGKPKLDGSSIIDAAQDFDIKGDVEVRMQMNPEGAQIWKVMTADNVGRPVAIVLDELVYSAPTVIGEIPNGNSSITLGGGDLNKQIQEAEDLANILKAGALPAPARIIDETIVGPSLGADNINKGMFSFAISLLGVLVYMALYYAGAGLIANVVLVVNLFILIGSLASIQAALTLPGIAGIVLTMGMAVDANVLIFERVREELRNGRVLKSAVDLGFKGALSAIIDSNVTTFLTAVILYLFGSGPIRGFATTLGIGILTSMFTAIFLSRMIITARLEKGKDLRFWNGWSKDLMAHINVDWMSRRRVFYLFSAVLLGICIFSMVTRGFNLGVDFSGGRTYVVQFKGDVEVEQVRSALEGSFISEEGVRSTVNVKTYGGARSLKVTTNYLVDEQGVESDARVEEKLNGGLSGLGVAYEISESRKVDPTISDDIKTSAIWAVLLALVFMFAYIAVRFNNWQFGVGALLALTHDALFVLGLYSLLNGIVPFSLEIDEAFIAAILTVIGYSVNDTVVVFDRIREYLGEHKRDSNIVVFNKAINATFGRTINTGVTTLLVLLVMFLLGGVSIKGFLFGLFMGILVGTYSSIFVASAIVVDLLRKRSTTSAPAVAATA
ncbi:MAG: protein translocase subunit SecDF [Flavobacteriales bacterium]|nr:protein translocase subunit SecDF [Flavobacteriales bacterium]